MNSQKDGRVNERDMLLPATEPLWTVNDVSNYLRLKQETVRMMARKRILPALKVGKSWRFKSSEIKNMLKSSIGTK